VDAGTALETVSSISLMCEPRDIGRTLGSEDVPLDREGYQPTLYLYDALPGGVGLARRIYERTEELFARAARLIAGCPCKSGCPACIGAALAEPQNATAGRKMAAIALLEGRSA
jgi:DEAD/DEAH box helicase domain-containing protein